MSQRPPGSFCRMSEARCDDYYVGKSATGLGRGMHFEWTAVSQPGLAGNARAEFLVPHALRYG